MKLSYSVALSVFFAAASALNIQLEEPELPPHSLRARKQIPVLGLLSFNFNKWSGMDSPTESEETASMVKSKEQMLGSKFQVQIINFTTDMFYTRHWSKMRVLVCSVMGAVLVMGLLLAPWKCWSGSSDRTASEMAAEGLADLNAVVAIGSGTWVHAYRNANAEQKDALELLFRCKIISVHEFAHSNASQEHIEECMWIAMQMLRQSPVEDWVVWRQQAVQSFEDSITAIYAARSTVQYNTPRIKGEYADAPPTPPLQGALNDLLHLKGGFASHSPLSRSRNPSAPPTPPLQGALNDLMHLRGDFASHAPLVRSRNPSNTSTAQASPVTPGRLPAHFGEYFRAPLPSNQDGMNITFDKAQQAGTFPADGMSMTFDTQRCPEGPHWHVQQAYDTQSLPPSSLNSLPGCSLPSSYA